MKWVKDKSGRFGQRPHYLPDELDAECEKLVNDFLRRKYGKVEFPITTDDLTVLIEANVEDLDLGADLTNEQGEVEGVTEFLGGKRIRVKISRHLVDNPRFENRLRTTLTHELGHVKLHAFMFEVEAKPLSLFPAEEEAPAHTNKCKRDNMISAAESDWMEWQAGYACSALLIPISPLIETVRAFRADRNLPYTDLTVDMEAGQALIERVSEDYQTSRDASRVRLLQKKFLSERTGGAPGLF